MKKIKVQSLEEIIKQKEWYYVNSDLTTGHFPLTTTETENPKIIKIGKTFTSQQALDEIKRQGCRPAMAWELAQWAVNHRDEMKKGTAIIALGQLWFDGGDRRVPCVFANSDGAFRFGLGSFEGDWCDCCCLLCFCDPALSTSDTHTAFDPLTLKKPISDLIPTLTINVGGKKEELILKSEIIKLLSTMKNELDGNNI